MRRSRRRRDLEEGGPAQDGETADGAATGTGTGTGTGVDGPDPRRDGPWDSTEHPVDDDDETRAHLGALSVTGHPEIEIRLQVDEASGQVAAVMLVTDEGAMELRAFAAPRHEDMWDEVRAGILAEAQQHGGGAREITGPFGPALQLMMPVLTPDGEQAVQPSVVLGISGPRWLLRATMLGAPAQKYDPAGLLENALRDVVVTRGTNPMTPGEPLPLTLPAGAQRLPPG